MTQEEINEMDKQNKADLKEMAHWYGFDELRKIIDQIEENENESAYERAYYEGDGVFADNH